MSERTCILCCAKESEHAQFYPRADGLTISLCERWYPGGVYEHGLISCGRCGEPMCTKGTHVCPPVIDGEFVRDWRIRTSVK